MEENENTATVLIKFLKGMELIGQVYNSNIEFATALMPASTEQFLTECGERLSMIEEALREG